MPSLVPDIENRVRKLPKPSNHAQGRQPLFEAVNNAFYTVEDRFGDEIGKRGKIRVDVRNIGEEGKLEIDVSDNGIGLDSARFTAFCTIDTDFKRAKGGKGVGRLFWLDAFSSVSVASSFIELESLKNRSFDFVLSYLEQVAPTERGVAAMPIVESGTIVTFKGLRIQPYRDHFPKKGDTLLRYFSSHFIADFLMGGGPNVEIDTDGELTKYPAAVSELVVGAAMETGPFELLEFGALSMRGFACRATASTGLDCPLCQGCCPLLYFSSISQVGGIGR